MVGFQNNPGSYINAPASNYSNADKIAIKMGLNPLPDVSPTLVTNSESVSPNTGSDPTTHNSSNNWYYLLIAGIALWYISK